MGFEFFFIISFFLPMALSSLTVLIPVGMLNRIEFGFLRETECVIGV